MKNKITEMKNTLEGINSRLNDTEEWSVSRKTDRAVAITATEQKKEKKWWQFKRLLGQHQTH